MDRDDLLLAQLAVDRGWVTRAQVDACTREQSEDHEATVGRKKLRPLGVILVSRRYITDKQLIELMGEVKKQASAPAVSSPGYRMIGEILVEQRLVGAAQVDETLAMQKSEAARGKKRRIGEILVEKSYATREQIVKALLKQDKTIMSCTGCGVRYNVVAYKPWIEYRCKKCNALLEMAAEMLDVNHSTATMRVIRDDQVPSEVKEATQHAGVQFGKYILVKEMLRGPFGALTKAWQKDTGRYVGLLFVAATDSQTVARAFSQVQQSLLVTGAASSRVIEVGEHQGKKYITVTLAS